MRELQAAGQIVGPRKARIEHLKKANGELAVRVVARDEPIKELTASRRRRSYGWLRSTRSP
ncbi:hypothetical protein [Streptomyces sp. NPDC059802]|uniref:hypothetical protein n=1 Tax=Streptomyces sp. NPDC059802 TaxID=3346952 RepID=UPI0036627743